MDADCIGENQHESNLNDCVSKNSALLASGEAVEKIDNSKNNNMIINEMTQIESPTHEEIDMLLDMNLVSNDPQGKILENKVSRSRSLRLRKATISYNDDEDSGQEDENDYVKPSSNLRQESWSMDKMDTFGVTQYNSDTSKIQTGKKRKRGCKGKVKCEMCDHVAPSQGELNKHYRKHSSLKPFKCPIEGCNYSTKYPKNCDNHIRITHSDYRPFECQICSNKFKRKTSLETHMLTHSDEKPIQCDKCPFRCKRNTELKSHVIHVHTTEKKFACHVCGLKTKFKSDLTKHLQTHIPGSHYHCELCGKGFTTSGALSKHRKYLHIMSRERNELCSICGKAFMRPSELANHISVVHEGQKNVICPFCGAKFANNSNLRTHIVIHDTTRSFECPVCKYRAVNELHLRAHIGADHQEFYFINFCRCCKKKFKKKALLRQHILTDIHTKNLKEMLLQSPDSHVFEYRLEIRNGYTKKNANIAYVIGTAPQVKDENDDDELPKSKGNDGNIPCKKRGRPRKLPSEKKSVDHASGNIIKEEPIDNEYPSSNFSDTNSVPRKRGRPKKVPIEKEKDLPMCTNKTISSKGRSKNAILTKKTVAKLKCDKSILAKKKLETNSKSKSIEKVSQKSKAISRKNARGRKSKTITAGSHYEIEYTYDGVEPSQFSVNDMSYAIQNSGLFDYKVEELNSKCDNLESDVTSATTDEPICGPVESIKFVITESNSRRISPVQVQVERPNSIERYELPTSVIGGHERHEQLNNGDNSVKSQNHDNSKSFTHNDICDELTRKSGDMLQNDKMITTHSSRPSQPQEKSSSGAPLFSSLRDLVSFYKN